MLTLASEYGDILRLHGISAAHMPDIGAIIDVRKPDDRQKFLEHTLWACEHIPEMIDKMGGHELCLRWIGCIQSGMVACGLLTIAQTRKRFREFADD